MFYINLFILLVLLIVQLQLGKESSGLHILEVSLSKRFSTFVLGKVSQLSYGTNAIVWYFILATPQTVQYSTIKILQTVNLLTWSCTGDSTVDQCSDLFRPLCLLNGDICFNDLIAIFIQGSRLYGRLHVDFPNSSIFVSVVFEK